MSPNWDFCECSQECWGAGAATLSTSRIPIPFLHILPPTAKLESLQKKSCTWTFITVLVFKFHSQPHGKKLRNRVLIPELRTPKDRNASHPEPQRLYLHPGPWYPLQSPGAPFHHADIPSDGFTNTVSEKL